MAEQDEVKAAPKQRPLRAASARAATAPTPRAASATPRTPRPSPRPVERPSAGAEAPKPAARRKPASKPAQAGGSAAGTAPQPKPTRSPPAAGRAAAATTPGPSVVAAASPTGRRRTAVLPPVEKEPTDEIDLRHADLDEPDDELDHDTGFVEYAGFDDDLTQWLAASEDNGETTERGRTSRRAPRRARTLSIAAEVIVVAVIAALGWQVLRQRSEINRYNNLDAQRATVLRVASKAAVDMTTYNYQHLPVFFSTIEAESTANYITVVDKDKTLLSEAFTQGHASSSATVAGSGISSMTASSAVVVLFVDQTVTNTLTKTPTKDLSRVELTLLRQHNQWLVDQVSLP